MNTEELKKKPYVAPVCRIIPLQTEKFICTSVVPAVPGTTEETWTEHEEDGGELEL